MIGGYCRVLGKWTARVSSSDDQDVNAHGILCCWRALVAVWCR